MDIHLPPCSEATILKNRWAAHGLLKFIHYLTLVEPKIECLVLDGWNWGQINLKHRDYSQLSRFWEFRFWCHPTTNCYPLHRHKDSYPKFNLTTASCLINTTLPDICLNRGNTRPNWWKAESLFFGWFRLHMHPSLLIALHDWWRKTKNEEIFLIEILQGSKFKMFHYDLCVNGRLAQSILMVIVG